MRLDTSGSDFNTLTNSCSMLSTKEMTAVSAIGLSQNRQLQSFPNEKIFSTIEVLLKLFYLFYLRLEVWALDYMNYISKLTYWSQILWHHNILDMSNQRTIFWQVAFSYKNKNLIIFHWLIPTLCIWTDYEHTKGLHKGDEV